jgi:non-ribosomal peptide synthetase component F
MAQRFERLFNQFFMNSPICEHSILSPNELKLINDLNDTYVDYGQIGCIHWEIARQAQQHPQKIALGLQNGSLSYGELLYYTQLLATHLITNYAIQRGDVICQLMERSFEMVIGMIAIFMSGAIYTALTPREPLARLLTCIQQTSAQLILIHRATQHIPLPNCSVLSIDQVISHYEEDNQYCSSLDIVDVTPEHISHIVFTSGSTGIPKAVCSQNS